MPGSSPGMTLRRYGRSPSALHHADVLDPDRAAVAEVDDEDGKPNRCLRRRDRQHEHRKGLADEVIQKDREGDEIDADREQHQLDRHQHDDHVLPVQKDAEDPEREQDRSYRQVMRQADEHQSLPAPSGTLTTSTVSARLRASWAEIDCRLTSVRWRRVSTIAPIIATSKISPAT